VVTRRARLLEPIGYIPGPSSSGILQPPVALGRTGDTHVTSSPETGCGSTLSETPRLREASQVWERAWSLRLQSAGESLRLGDLRLCHLAGDSVSIPKSSVVIFCTCGF